MIPWRGGWIVWLGHGMASPKHVAAEDGAPNERRKRMDWFTRKTSTPEGIRGEGRLVSAEVEDGDPDRI